MTKAKAALQRQPAAAAAALEQPLDSFFAINRAAFERWMQGMMEISQEIAQFTQARLEEDAAAWVKLAGCRTPNEAFECQQRFLEKASGQYLAETNRLSQIMAGLANAGASGAQQAGMPF